MSATSPDHPHLFGPGLATIAVIAASVGFGLVPYFARTLTAEGMAPHAIAFFRYAFAAIVLLPSVWLARAQWVPIAWGLVAGIGMGVGWIGYVRALELAPVSTVGVLYMTYPVFTLLIAWLMFGDVPRRRAILAAVMIVGAAALATSPDAVSVSGWWLVAGIAFGSALVPQLLYTVAAPAIGTARTAIAGSFELPTMFLVGWFAFAEPVGPAQWIACAIIISAIALTPGKSIRSVAVNIAVDDENVPRR